MSAALGLWLFWVAMVAVIVVFGAGPLFAAMSWAVDRDGISGVPVRAIGVGAVFMLVWVPLLVVGIGFGMAPRAHALGLEW